MLVEPAIPQNTGNIARTCAVTGCALHLVGPMGFNIDDSKLRRAGLDYWHMLNISYYDSLNKYLDINNDKPMYLASTTGDFIYTECLYPDGCHILFGKETTGLPRELLYNKKKSVIKIPQIQDARSLNLSNAVAIITYEALRSQGFPNMR